MNSFDFNTKQNTKVFRIPILASLSLKQGFKFTLKNPSAVLESLCKGNMAVFVVTDAGGAVCGGSSEFLEFFTLSL